MCSCTMQDSCPPQHFSIDSLNDDEDLKVHDVDHYCEQTYTFQKELFTKIDSNIQKAQDQYKKNYDKKINQKKVM